MARYTERFSAPAADLIGGNPAIRRADFYKLRDSFEDRAFADPRIDPACFMVLKVLVRSLNAATLECWPSIKTIAEKCGKGADGKLRISERSVRRHLATARACGYVSWSYRATLRGRVSSSYRFGYDLAEVYPAAAADAVSAVLELPAVPSRNDDGTFQPKLRRVDAAPVEREPPGRSEARAQAAVVVSRAVPSLPILSNYVDLDREPNRFKAAKPVVRSIEELLSEMKAEGARRWKSDGSKANG